MNFYLTFYFYFITQMHFDFDNAEFEGTTNMHEVLRKFEQMWCRDLRYDSTSFKKWGNELIINF